MFLGSNDGCQFIQSLYFAIYLSIHDKGESHFEHQDLLIQKIIPPSRVMVISSLSRFGLKKIENLVLHKIIPISERGKIMQC